MDQPTLSGLEVFRAVADAGSFSAAARSLGRAQSAVSTTIANLEAELGVILFERDGRRPTLTEAGRVLLQDARAVSAQVQRLVGRAASLRRGVEAELRLVVDVMFPLDRLIGAIHAVTEAHPEVSLRIRTEALGAVTEAVQAGEADVGVCPALDARSADLDAVPVGTVELVPVVAAGHPLAAGPISAEALAAHVQIVLSSRDGPDRGVFSPRTWRVGDLVTRKALVKAGFGWGNLPRHVVAGDLADGSLVALTIECSPSAGLTRGPPRLPVVAISRRVDPPGPAGRTFVAALGAP